MKLIYGSNVKEALREIGPTHIAVAYVGADWAEYLDASVLEEIVLSPTIGTNPKAVAEIGERIGWDNVYFLDNLHAKFYLGSKGAAIGSFNLTANGLSGEGLNEAGFAISDPAVHDDLRRLLNDYKALAARSYPTQASKLKRLAELRAQWDRAIKAGVIRNDAKPETLSSYLPLSPDEIYVCCVWGEVAYSEEIPSTSVIHDCASFLESDNVQPDRWMLCWHSRDDGYPDERQKPYWLHIDEVVTDGAVDPTYTKLAIERNDREPMPPPFELTENVVKALLGVLKSGAFPAFLGDRTPWSLNSTLPDLPGFFDAVRVQLASQSMTTASPADVLKTLRAEFAERIRTAMDIALQKKIVTTSIERMLTTRHPVEVAKKLVQSPEIESGLKKLAAKNALHLSFEKIMLEKRFGPLFTKQDLECAVFKLRLVDSNFSAGADSVS